MKRVVPIVLTTLAVSILGGTSCTFDKVVSDAGLPGTHFAAQVSDVEERGSYIDAFVDAGGFEYRFFFPNDDVCRRLTHSTEGLRFTWLGVMGRIEDGESRCDAVGVLSLQAWRDRQPRMGGEPLPRAPASYHEIYRDSDLIELYGRFPLASRLGFAGTAQLVAVIPNDDVCRPLADQATASMEFRASGPRPLILIAGDRLCNVLGIAQPPPQTTPSP